MTEEAIPAATLIVVRERPCGPPELLMVERWTDEESLKAHYALNRPQIGTELRRLSRSQAQEVTSTAASVGP